MAVDASRISEGLISIERGGERYLGVDTGIPSNSPSLRKLAGQRRQAGKLISGSAVGEWRPQGFIEYEGRVHVYGPLHTGRFVEQALHDEASDRLEMLERVARILASLSRAGIEPFPFHTRAIILLDDGGAIVLPPDILQTIREHQDYESRIERMERFNHPDRSPAENVGYALAVASYYVITGTYPFDGADEEELHARMRAASPLPAADRDVTIRDDVSQALQDQLSSAEDGADPEQWARRLAAWRAEGVYRDLSDEERARREEVAHARAARIEKSFRRKESVRRNGRTALIVAAIAIVVGTIPGTIIRNALQPRATAGLPPEEVVRVFYTSINTLDHMTMEDAVVEDAGRALIREVTNLFVLDRQRMSVEMESGFVDAQRWRDEGMPPLPTGRSPYGVANLSISNLEAPDGERRYEVVYERWLPDYEQAELTGVAGINGFRNVDVVSLRLDGEDWVIYRIDQLEHAPVDPDELEELEDGA